MEITRRNLLGAGAAVGAGLLLPLNLRTVANAAKPIPNVLMTFTERLPTLADLGVIDATGGTVTAPATATIEMVRATTHSFHTALGLTPTFAYRTESINGVPVTGTVTDTQDYLGPVIVARRGEPFDLTVKNNLGTHPLATAIDTRIMHTEDTDALTPRAAVHLHGGNTDPANDGDPMDVFAKGALRTYHYGNTQEAAGLWYHDHAVGITRLNVFAGLAGGYLVRDENDPGDGTTGLPPALTANLGNYEVPLILQDRAFWPTTGEFNYPRAPWIPEFFGDVATVNGKAWPNLAVDQGKYRFRVVNGSNARFYNLQFVPGKAGGKTGSKAMAFSQIGTDGGLLDAPVLLTSLLLAPGERADLVVDFAALAPGATVVLTNDANTPFPNGPRKVKKGGMPLPQIMQFTGTGSPGWITPLPTTLRLPAPAVGTTPAPDASTGPITRLAGQFVATTTNTKNMTLVEVLDPLGVPLMVLMNNTNFAPDDATMTVGTDTLEQWDLINTTVDAHPMHLHFTQFQVLNRQKFNAAAYLVAAYGVKPAGAPEWPIPGTGSSIPVAPFLRGGVLTPAPNEQGWKDTVVVMPGEVTRILVPFGAKPTGVTGPMAIGASHIGKYVSHCHILEHEENDMMMRFTIV